MGLGGLASKARAAFAELSPAEQLGLAGAAALPTSMLFPWYGFKLGSTLSATAFDAFNLAHAVLLLTAGAVGWMLLLRSRRDWPRPLDDGALLIVAGVWSLLVLAFLVADPPDLIVDTLPIGGVEIRYGMIVALAGAGAMVAAGVRIRRERTASPDES